MQRRSFLQAFVAAVTAAPVAAEAAVSTTGTAALLKGVAYAPGECSAVKQMAAEIFDPGEAMRDMAVEAMQRGEVPAYQSYDIITRQKHWQSDEGVMSLKSVSPCVKQLLVEENNIARAIESKIAEHAQNQIIRQAEKWVASKNPFAEFMLPKHNVRPIRFRDWNKS